MGEPLLPLGKQIWEGLKCSQPTGELPCPEVPVEGLTGDWLLSLLGWEAMGQPSKPAATFSKEEVEK